jgi:hypothetical protein
MPQTIDLRASAAVVVGENGGRETNSLQGMTLSVIADAWIKRLQAGKICFDPARVESRWVCSPAGSGSRVQTLLNESRKQRLGVRD